MAAIATKARDVFVRLYVRARHSDRGASLVEYAMLVALVALVAFSAVTFFGQATSSKLSVNASCFNSECH